MNFTVCDYCGGARAANVLRCRGCGASSAPRAESDVTMFIRMDVPISAATWSERAGIPLAQQSAS